VNSPEEAFEDEHFKARGFQTPVHHEDIDRTILYPGAPYSFEKTPWQLRRRAPKLGEHTSEVLAEVPPRLPRP
jgi:crotonobetainyl-CoA:carnitine CoA-transferase CaiB-like acyl-CoA transferase